VPKAVYLIPFFIYASVLWAVDKNLKWKDQLIDALAISEQVYFVDHFYAFDNLLMGYQSDPDMQLLSRTDDSITVMQTERSITHQPVKSSLKSQDLVIFKSGKLRGTGILLDDFVNDKPMQIRMWLPSLRKVRRFAEPGLDDIWGGSHLTYGDLYLRRPRHEIHELVEWGVKPRCLEDIKKINRWSSAILNKEINSWCNLNPDALLWLRSTPVEASPWYDYRIRLIDQQNYAEYQSEYFKSGNLVKRIQKNWHPVDLEDPRALIWNFWTVVLFEEGQSVGESLAWIEDESYAWNQSVNQRLWSEKTLTRIRR